MSRGTGLDPGSTAIRLAEVSLRKGEVALTRYHSVAVAGNQTPIEVADAFAALRKQPAPVRVGLTGSDVMMRYLPVPQVEDWRLERLMDFEVRELESRSGSPLATSFNLLPVQSELDDEDTILLGLIKEELLEGWMDALGKLPVHGFSPNSIALYNAFIALGDHQPAVTLIANIGHGTIDLALVRGTELYFARSVSTSLAKKDETLARSLGIDAARARGLIHKHIDLRGATGQRLGSEAERVTRPLVPLYDPLPTLLSGVITLCKSQARLQDLALDRILLTGGGANANGLDDMLTQRCGVTVEVWNPADMIDINQLDDAQADDLEADGTAATIVIGLALSAADEDFYALEILSKAARKKRDFQQRGIFSVMAVVCAVAFLVLDYVVQSNRASEMMASANRLDRQARTILENDRRAEELELAIVGADAVYQDLLARAALRQSAEQMLNALSEHLPANLWVESFSAELSAAQAWGMKGAAVPTVTVTLRGEDRELRADEAFTNFSERVKQDLPGGDRAIRIVSKDRGRNPLWTLTAVLLVDGPGAIAMEDEE
ncbi:MAG: hypothetical protein COB96_01970 [Planctomycetota bacterium]|nr:MAG: hypothetical protein COB96_01970 [Planctomycetota bacterium]